MTIALRGYGLATLTAALFVALAQPGSAQNLKYKPISVKTPDGLTISAQEWGNPQGPEILSFTVSHKAICRGCGR